MHFPYPFRIARGEVIVHRHEMGVARERVQVQRHRGDQRFAFARRHFRDPSIVQGDPAKDLHVERNHVPFVRLAAHQPFLANEPAAGVLHGGERFGQQIIQRRALGEPLAEFVRLRAKLLVGKLLVFRLDFVDAVHHRPEPLHLALVLRTHKFFQYPTNHNQSLVPSGKTGPPTPTSDVGSTPRLHDVLARLAQRADRRIKCLEL